MRLRRMVPTALCTETKPLYRVHCLIICSTRGWFGRSWRLLFQLSMAIFPQPVKVLLGFPAHSYTMLKAKLV